MVHKKIRNYAKNTGLKNYHQKTLDSEAKIILVLKNQQPLEVQQICERAKISLSTFYRHYNIMELNGLVKKIDNEYALWYYNETPNLWERVQARMLAAGGRPIKLEVEKLRLGEQDPITGWFKLIYDEKIMIEGVIIPKAAPELIEAAKINMALDYGEFSLILITKDDPGLGARFIWQEYECKVWNQAKIYEGNDLSYNIFFLRTAWRG